MANYIIFGGSFDPIHNGHLRIATFASIKLNASVIFVPAKNPRWKKTQSSIEDRINMLESILISDAPAGSTISEFEARSANKEVNYTINTVRYLKKKYKADNLYLLIGSDQVERFPEWKEAKELSKLVKIVFVLRPNEHVDEDIVEEYKMMELQGAFGGIVSSTSVREMKSLDVPVKVLEYMEKNKLYYFDSVSKYVSEERYNHMVNVANLSYSIAKANKLDKPEDYFIAGLLHDIGKAPDLDKVKAKEFIEINYPEYKDCGAFCYHQFIGEYLAKKDFGIKDKDILEAIKYHCTGYKNLSNVTKVVYVADKIEPGREFNTRPYINKCLKGFDKGFIKVLKLNYKYLNKSKKHIDGTLSKEFFKYYLGK